MQKKNDNKNGNGNGKHPKLVSVKFDRIEGSKIVYLSKEGKELRRPLTASPFKHNIEVDPSDLK